MATKGCGMAERTLKANGIEIWTEDFGDPSAPPILLIMGATAQGLHWPESFCEQLVARGRYVIRYDNRDTGQTSCFDFADDPYTLDDMARDAVGVLEGYGLKSAHVVGASMGGMIAQLVALDFPDRVRTLTLVFSSPISSAAGRDVVRDPGDLPGPTQPVLGLLDERAERPPQNRAERIEYGVKLWRTLSGSFAPFDENWFRALETRCVDRALNHDASFNHVLVNAHTAPRPDALKALRVPTLVIHGTEDPILPYAHGVALADQIEGAELVPIEGLGHELPPATFERFSDAILSHTS